jgi:hypothetical protein
VTHQLIRQADDISVHVIAERTADQAAPETDTALTLAPGQRRVANPNAYLGSAGFVAVALGIGTACSNSSKFPTSRSCS